MRPKPNRDVAFLPSNVLLNLQDAALVLSAVTAFWMMQGINAGAAYVSVVKSLLSFSLFTLHHLAWNPDKHRGFERWRVALTLHHSSLLFTYKCKSLTHNGIATEPKSPKSSSPIKRWRVGEESLQLFTHPTTYPSAAYTQKVKSEEFLEKFSRTQQICKKSRIQGEYSESLIYAMD